MMSERAFEWSDIAVVGCIPESRDGWQKCRKKSLGKVCSLCSQMLRG